MNYYVIGHGHSGSTLLDIFLASREDTFSLGEFHVFLHWGENSCLCGEQVDRCPLWGRVLELFEPSWLLKLEERRRKYDKLGWWLIHDWKGWKDYIAQYASLINAVRKLSGKSFVVESSKSNWINVLRPYNFYKANDGRANFVCMIKRPSAVVASCLRSDERKGRKIWKFTPLKHGISWLVSNTIALIYSVFLNVAVVDYGRFVRKPGDYAEKFSVNLSGRKFNFSQAHYIAGNRMVKTAADKGGVEILEGEVVQAKNRVGALFTPLYYIFRR